MACPSPWELSLSTYTGVSILMTKLERGEILVHLLSKAASRASPSCLLPHKVHQALDCARPCAGLDTRQRRKHGSFESSTVQLQSCGHAVGTQWALPLDNTSSTVYHDNLALLTSLRDFLLSSLLLGLGTLDLLRGDLSRKLIPSQPESLERVSTRPGLFTHVFLDNTPPH